MRVLLLIIVINFCTEQIDSHEFIGNRWQHPAGRMREYFIAAVEVEWDYAPTGRNLVDNQRRDFERLLANKDDRIGRIYSKVVLRGFTDATFTRQVQRQPWMGLLGPIIRAEIGDEVMIHFRNFATVRPYSLHPHGFRYIKNGEGALYIDNESGPNKLDDGVPPGGAFTYVWNITRNFAPTSDDDNCLSGGYHSHTSSSKDISTGLVGLLLLCKKGILSDNNERMDGWKDLILYPDVVIENESWKIKENLKKCGNPAKCKQLLDSRDGTFGRGFFGSNVMSALNGYMYGHLNYDVIEGERIAMHVMSLNLGAHGISIYGQTLKYFNRRTSTINVFPATFISTQLIPVNPGRWLVHCRVTGHYKEGMRGFLTVHRRNVPLVQGRLDGRIRRYYIAAEEMIWDYGPTGKNFIDKESLTTPGSKSAIYFSRPSNRIGGRYKKARFVQYTDKSFCKRIPRNRKDRHLGLLGPVIRTQVGEKVEVVFHNNATRSYSFLPHGVYLEKKQEGALYRNDFRRLRGKIARPGETIVYRFTVPDFVSPTSDDAQCITHTYHSSVDPVKDIYSGLIGPLLVCKRGTLERNGKQKSVDREFHLFFNSFDENESWYIDENIQRFAENSSSVNKRDTSFVASNRMSSINGLMFGNLRGLDMCVADAVSWHVTGYGTFDGNHGSHFDGNTLKIFQKTKDSQAIIPGTSYTGIMRPDNPGSWQLVCRSNFYFANGMKTLYNVHPCGSRRNKMQRLIGGDPGRTRRYFIAAIETDWDYAPVKVHPITGEDLNNPNTTGHLYVKDDANFIGSIYKKAVYREFTDSSFAVMKKRTSAEKHLGLLGPFIKAEIFDKIEVVFRNMASRPYSIHPNGVYYDKGNEGTRSVSPGDTYTYHWTVPPRAGPSYNEPNCIPWLYYSFVDSVNDSSSGLVGPLVICRPGYLNDNNKRNDVDHEFAILFSIFDENLSWYLQQNIQRFAPNRTDPTNNQFFESNRMSSINGLLFGNLRGLVMEEHQSIAWYVLGIGSFFDDHTAHFHGQTFLYRSNTVHRGDVIEVLSGTTETVEMFTDNPGTWLLHCHVNPHVEAGMETTYTILPRL